MPFNIQGPELILILIIALIVIGPGKLPDVGAALGRSIREFRKASADVKEATAVTPVATPPAPPAAIAPVSTAAPVAPPVEVGATPATTSDADDATSSGAAS